MTCQIDSLDLGVSELGFPGFELPIFGTEAHFKLFIYSIAITNTSWPP